LNERPPWEMIVNPPPAAYDIQVMKYPKTTLALIAMLVYLPTLFFDYVYLDDYLLVQESGFYAKLSNIPASFTRSVWHPTGSEYNYYRPASISVYILGAWLSTAISQDVLPWVFHLTNVLLKAGVAALLFAFLRGLGSAPKPALIATLALIIHPSTAGTLGWISGQNELLLAVWVLTAFIAFLKSFASPVWLLLHGFSFLAALLTKENSIALPILCALFLLCSSQRWTLKIWLASLATWIGTLIIWFLMIRQGASQSAPAADGALQGMLHGFPYLLIYLGRLVWPVGLSTLPTPQDTWMITWAAGVLGALTMIGVVIVKFRVKPLVILGLAWYVGFLLPTFANMVPALKDSFILRADRGYLASVGVLILLLQLNWTRGLPSKAVKTFAALGVAALVLLNLAHQFDYSSGMRFYKSAVSGSPRSAFAHTHLADMHLSEKNFALAIKHYEQAIRLNDFEPQAHNNLGVVYLRMGESEKAAAKFRAELERNPKNLLSWYNLGSIQINRGAHDEAEKSFRRAAEINPAYKDAWLGLVQVYTFQRKTRELEEALKALQNAEMDMSRGL